MVAARSVSKLIQPYVVDLASHQQRWQYRALVIAWLLGQASFWSWWLREDHIVTPVGMLINSLLLLWTTFLPAWYPQVVAAVYFDDRNSAVNHSMVSQPDWQLSAAPLQAFRDLARLQ
jgi:hypothetical protein